MNIRRFFQAAALAAAPLLLGACTNQVTPEGHQGYVYHVPLFFGAAHYVETLTGPTSTGVTWRHYVVNVDIRPKNYTEDFSVKQLIEEYGSGDPATPEGHPEWFVRAVRQQYRSAVRDVVYTYDAYEIQTKTQDIGARILQRLRDEYGASPVEFEAISIGNITYPDAINAEIQQKLAAEQDLERMNRERQIAEQEAQIMITQAKGRASAQRIVNETLTPLYVQHEMIEGFRALAKSPRVTIVASPASAGGGAPVILNLGQ